MLIMNKLREMMLWERLMNRIAIRDRNPWKRGNRNRTRVYRSADRIRAHKRARWEMAKLSRRANRRSK